MKLTSAPTKPGRPNTEPRSRRHRAAESRIRRTRLAPRSPQPGFRAPHRLHQQQPAEVFASLAAFSGSLISEYDLNALKIIHGFLGRLIDGSRDFLDRLPFDGA
ncbi:hypothetical protein [Actinoplanes couchii]|uniref:hypothetical protein n=1 Tax=Actinoplanes couchii TaxID=403638 RepID=UPI001944BA67|nr:hypothetical protein [Actinoplanes couchii]MDR6320760.1 hypothetical protein [Actinoplanes couchii]